MEWLAGKGYRAIAPNLRGYSPGANPREASEYNLDKLTADVIGIADAANVERFHLVGHDWGGALAWAVAGAHPKRLLSLTVLSTPHSAAMLEAMRNSTQGLRSSYMAFFRLPRVPELVLNFAGLRSAGLGLRLTGLPAGSWHRDREQLRRVGGLRGPLNWYRGAINRNSKLRRVSVPTMYIWGKHDFALGRRAAELTARYVTGPYRFEEINAGHWIIDRNAAELQRLLGEQLEDFGVPAARPPLRARAARAAERRPQTSRPQRRRSKAGRQANACQARPEAAELELPSGRPSADRRCAPRPVDGQDGGDDPDHHGCADGALPVLWLGDQCHHGGDEAHGDHQPGDEDDPAHGRSLDVGVAMLLRPIGSRAFGAESSREDSRALLAVPVLVLVAACGGASAPVAKQAQPTPHLDPRQAVLASVAKTSGSSFLADMSLSISMTATGPGASYFAQLQGQAISATLHVSAENEQRMRLTFAATAAGKTSNGVGVLYDGTAYTSSDNGATYKAQSLSGGLSDQIASTNTLSYLQSVGTVTDEGPGTADGVSVERYSAQLDGAKVLKLVQAELGTAQSTSSAQKLVSGLTFKAGALEVTIDHQGRVVTEHGPIDASVDLGAFGASLAGTLMTIHEVIDGHFHDYGSRRHGDQAGRRGGDCQLARDVGMITAGQASRRRR